MHAFVIVTTKRRNSLQKACWKNKTVPNKEFALLELKLTVRLFLKNIKNEQFHSAASEIKFLVTIIIDRVVEYEVSCVIKKAKLVLIKTRIASV